MYNSQSTPTLPSVQPAVRNNSITSFPVQATIHNAPRAMFPGKLHTANNPVARDGETVTIVGRRGGFHYAIVLADGTQGYAFARDVTVIEPEPVVDQDVASLFAELYNADGDVAYRLGLCALLETFNGTPDLPLMLVSARAYQEAL